MYERADGSLDEREEEELPFDISGDELEITDADYAIWYMDCLDNPKKYEGKKVSFLALVYNPDKLKKGIFVPGRFAMTCCVEDITFIGFSANIRMRIKIPHKSWIHITAQIKVEFAREYKGKGPVLYPISITPAEKAGRRTCLFFIGAECVGILRTSLLAECRQGGFCLECNTMKENTGYLQNVRNIYNVSNKVSYCSMNGGNR